MAGGQSCVWRFSQSRGYAGGCRQGQAVAGGRAAVSQFETEPAGGAGIVADLAAGVAGVWRQGRAAGWREGLSGVGHVGDRRLDGAGGGFGRRADTGARVLLEAGWVAAGAQRSGFRFGFRALSGMGEGRAYAGLAWPIDQSSTGG